MPQEKKMVKAYLCLDEDADYWRDTGYITFEVIPESEQEKVDLWDNWFEVDEETANIWLQCQKDIEDLQKKWQELAGKMEVARVQRRRDLKNQALLKLTKAEREILGFK